MLLFDRREKNHVINWMVARHPDYASAMELIEPRNLNDGLPSTAAFKNANTLIANMQIEGPMRSEFPKYQYDHKVDLHHCHVTMGKNSYDVIWEVHEQYRLIYILDIAKRENFDYVRTVSKETSLNHALETLLTSPSHQKIFVVPNMVINPALKKMYAPFMAKEQDFPNQSDGTIVNMSKRDVMAAQRAERQASRSRPHKALVL